MDELTTDFSKQTVTTVPVVPVLFSIKIQSSRHEDKHLISILEPYKNHDFEHFRLLLPMPGSVYILCTSNCVPDITHFEIGDSTFLCESIDIIDEIDREDSNGELMEVLYKTSGAIKVEPDVVVVALEYLKKTCSGTNKKNKPCGNRVREAMSRCRWHSESII